MSQLDRHLTIEQLSALLDNLQEDAGTESRGHLASCQHCQQELAELRQTINLLHALPQPVLPRSFVLPAGIIQITPERMQAQSEPNIHILRSTNSSSQQTRKRARTSTGHRVLSFAGTLAAVIGILFVLSGFVPSMPQMAASTSTSSGGSSVSADAPTNSGPSSANGSVNSAASSAGTGQQNSTPAVEQPRSVLAPDPTPVQNVAGIQPAQKQETEQKTALPTTTSSFDEEAAGIRIGLGILLFIVGMMGIAVGRERSKKAKA